MTGGVAQREHRRPRSFQHGADRRSVIPVALYSHTDLNLSDIHDGYIPDLMLVNSRILAAAQDADVPHLFPHQIGLVMEVTSRIPTGASAWK